MALTQVGCDIAALCPAPGHPFLKTSAVRQTLHYDGRRPLASLRRAIEGVRPDIIIPLCDRGVEHLHELHALTRHSKAPENSIASLIERSLGSPSSFAVVSSRYRLLEAAREEEVLVPEMIRVDDIGALDLWCSRNTSPWVIKADGTWGGRGVRIAESRNEADHVFAELSMRPGIFEFLKRLVLNRDRDWILSEWKHARRGIVAQTHIQGRPANCAVTCWEGEVLAGIGVEVIEARGPKEPAMVVQVSENSDMMRSAEKIARRLHLSGFVGFDFIIENGTGATYLIEMNPRCTPPVPIAMGKGRDLAVALCSRLTSDPVPDRTPVTEKDRITYFPKNWGMDADPQNAIPVETTYYDLPDGEPALIQDLLHPWSSRSLIGRGLDSLRRRLAPGTIPKSCIFEVPKGPVPSACVLETLSSDRP